MFRLLRKNRGQSTLEYAILIVVVIMALIGMQAYLKRGISGRMKDSTDQIGEQFNPNYQEGNITTTTGGSVIQRTFAGGGEETEYDGQFQDQTGSMTMTGNLEVESYL
jgi:Flp pilus assembly pilin Flp